MNANIITTPLEAETRFLIDNNLASLGWQMSGINKNVFFEQPKFESERQKLNGKRPDYVLYSNSEDRPLIVIEAKRRGSRIDSALEQGINYAKVLNAPLVFATDGAFCKAFHIFDNCPPILNGDEVDELIRESMAIRFLAGHEVNTISKKVQYDRQELIKIFDKANNVLRGDGLRAGIERFGEFANILFLKLISESEQIKSESGIKSKFDSSCSWNTIKNTAPSARIDYINQIVFSRLNEIYGSEIFTALEIHDANILNDIMEKIDPLTLTDIDSDIKGDAFEYFLKASTSTKNDLGEYFTPRHIVKTMVRLVNPVIGEKIYDPFCGTGGFLIESFRHIERNIGVNDQLKKILREETIYGNEITKTARITKMNMILAGDGHSNIHKQDSLANPIDGKFDAVITNMPYAQTTKFGNLYDLPTTNGDSVCIQHCMKAINSTALNGRMALVVPEGFLFRKDLSKIREYLLSRCELQTILSLPQGVFLPYTGVKTDIIFATKVNQKIKSSERKNFFWYFDVKSDGYTLDNHRRKINAPNDLTKFEEFRRLDEDQSETMIKNGFEKILIDSVKKNSFILVGSRYREIKISNSSYPIVDLGDVCTFEYGYTDSAKTEGDVRFIRITDIDDDGKLSNGNIRYINLNEKNQKYLLKKNDILVARIGSYGKTLLFEEDFPAIFASYLIRLKLDSRILPKYYFYYTKSQSYWTQAKKLVTGAIQPQFNANAMKLLKLPVPPLEEQNKIVEELDGYQKIISGARLIVENYKILLPEFHNYKIVKLPEVCDINKFSVEPKKAFGENKFTYIDIASVENETGKIDKSNILKGTAAPSRARRIFHKGDVLMSTVRPNLKAFTYIDFDTENFVASTGFAVLTPKNINGKYLLYALLDDFVGNQLISAMSKAMYPSVNKSDLENLEIKLPSIEEQNKIVQQIEIELKAIKPAEEAIKIFSKKIEERIKNIWNS